MDYFMVMADQPKLTVTHIKEIGSTTINMGTEKKNGEMAEDIKVITDKGKSKAREFILGQMDQHIKEIGSII